MNMSAPYGAAPEGDRVELLWRTSDRVFCRLRSADADACKYAFVPVIGEGAPAQESIRRLAHEYELKGHLDAEWALRPVELVRERAPAMLIVEYTEGEPLSHVTGRPLEIGRFLRLSARLAGALAKLHGRGLIHKDLKPANVLADPADTQVWLTGFGVASRVPRERPSLEPPECIAGTLPYMSPEQTGRINRSVDSRSDLYSLGIVLYEMLTGVLPFMASEPMEWVHCHIAKQPAAPTSVRPDTPQPISAIIMKLLSKAPEERYQTANGVEHDLRRCLSAWQASEQIDEFRLGASDAPDHLVIQEKLYGREREVETLLAAFERIVSGERAQLVLVSGYSGIGKSAVVNELHRHLVPPRGLFAAGKFDQYKRDIPYATLAQAFRSLLRPLLSKSEQELSRWREALHQALEPHGQLMVDLVPELKAIVGEQPPLPELPAHEAQHRFHLVFRRFIGVFAQPDHPLALFLDDLQWLDAATLDLLEDLLTRPDVRHLLLIGAYRSNEVDCTHPLQRKLQALREAGARFHDIVLEPLTRDSLEELIADSLHTERAHVSSLAEIVYGKTGGNPFFAIQFVSALVDEGMVSFEHAAGHWAWDPSRIRARGYTDNVVHLMVRKVTRLSAKAQDALKQLACLGSSADFSVMRAANEASIEQTHVQLAEAVGAGFVRRSTHSYHFLHDRVQEAAYSLIPEDQRAEVHLRIGMSMASNTPADMLEERIFEIVNQLNRGHHLITSAVERERVAELNLMAGRRAKNATAYASALTYCAAGLALLPEDRWARQRALTFALELQTGECEFLTAELTAAEERLARLASRAGSAVEHGAVACLRVDLYTTLAQSDRAVTVCFDYLRQRGAAWSSPATQQEVRQEYEQIWAQIGNRPIEALVDLPLMRDPDSLATLDVLVKVVPPALHTDTNFLALAVCRMVNLSLARGNGDGSCFAYVWLGMLAGPLFDDYQAGFRFGRLGYELVEQRGLPRFKAATYMCFGSHVLPWTRHIRAGRQLVRQAFDEANRTGDLTFATYCCENLNRNLLSSGEPLAEVQREAETGLAFARKTGFGHVVDQILGQLALIHTLRGLTQTFGSFDLQGFHEAEFERHLAGNVSLQLPECWYWIKKLQARFLSGDHGEAIDASLRAERLLWTSPSHFEVAEYHFYSALAHAAAWEDAAEHGRAWHLTALEAHQRQLQVWAQNCPDNFDNRAALVGAEIARIQGRTLDAEYLFEQAIELSQRHGFVHHEAIANELAGRFYAGRGFRKIAIAYLRDARSGYQRWGADGKVRHLEHLHPHLMADRAPFDLNATMLAPLEQLDLATVIKVSEAVSGEIVLESLIDTLMRAAIEHAGAERGLLILPSDGEYRIEAEATTSGGTLRVELRSCPAASAAAPQSILRYVLRTKECVLLHDASGQSPFSDDEYVRTHRARSVLCLPLLKQTRLLGVLYLENNLTRHSFTPGRMAVLKLLASAAAVSLENTRLYRDVQEREARVRRLVDANIIGICIWKTNGSIVDANDAFLDIVGYGREDLAAGLRWLDLTPPEWHGHAAKAVSDAEANGVFQPFEKEYLRKDGRRVPALVGGALFEGCGNEGVAFVLDLSEQKKAERALRRSQAFLAEGQCLSQTGTFLWQVATGEITWSEQMYRIYQMESGAPLNLDALRARVHPEDVGLLERMMEGAQRGVQDLEWQYRLRFPDQSIKYLHALAHAGRDENGQLEYIAAVQDVTARRLSEDALDTARAQLAHVARNASLGVLTASIAHEISQPLSGIITNATTCLRMISANPPNLDGARATAQRTLRDGARASDVIRRLRDLFARKPPAKDVIDLNDAVREVVALTAGELQMSGVVVQVELDAALPRIRADRIQLQQVILNLIVNAADAMRSVDVRPRALHIVTACEGEDGVRLSVRDCGVGLDPGHVERLFEPFHTTKSHGMGIGLSISRTIIESHGGCLWGAPNQGPGATFSFIVPAGVVPDAGSSPPRSSSG